MATVKQNSLISVPGAAEMSGVPFLRKARALIGAAVHFPISHNILPFLSRTVMGDLLTGNERSLKSGQLQPELAWHFIVKQITHGKHGGGKDAPTTDQIQDFYDTMVNSLDEHHWNEYAARFIEVGREYLLDGFSQGFLNEAQRTQLKDYYTDLTLGDRLGEGRKQYWHNIATSITEADNTDKDNVRLKLNKPSIMDGMFTNTKKAIESPTYGSGATHPLVVNVKNEVRSVFEVELQAFLGSDAYQELPPDVRHSIIRAANIQILPGIRDNHDVRNVSSLGRIYANISAATANPSYFETRAQALIADFDKIAEALPTDETLYQKRKRLARSEKMQSEVKSLIGLLSDTSHGIGGKSPEAAKAIIKQIEGLVKGYALRKNPILQASIFETLQDEVLKVYQQTKTVEIRDLYKRIVATQFISLSEVDKTITGQNEFYDQQIETPEKARAYFHKIITHLQDPQYGAAAGEYSLADEFVQQAKEAINRAKKQGSDVQATIYKIAADAVKTTARESKDPDPSVIAKLADIHHSATEELEASFSAEEPSQLFVSVTETQLSLALFGNTDQKVQLQAILEENKELTLEDYVRITYTTLSETGGRIETYLREHGKITLAELDTLRQQTNDQLTEQPLLDFWNTYITDLIDTKIGVGGIYAGSASTFATDVKKHFTAVKEAIKKLDPERQQKFLETGFKQLLLWLDTKDESGGAAMPFEVFHLEPAQKKVIAQSFKDLVADSMATGTTSFTDGVHKLYFEQIQNTDFTSQLITHLQNPTYGVEGEYSVVDALLSQVKGMTDLLIKPPKDRTSPENIQSEYPQLCYEFLTRVQNAVKTAIDEPKNIKIYEVLKTVFTDISKVIAVDYARYGAEKMSLTAVAEGEEARKSKESSTEVEKIKGALGLLGSA